MGSKAQLPMPSLDALPLGAHSLYTGSGEESAKGLVVLTDEALYEACSVRIAFTSRHGGVSEGMFASLNCASHVNDDPNCVARNRRIVLDALGANQAQLIVPNQVHGCTVLTVKRSDEVDDVQKLADDGADGLLVEAPDVAALLNFADCLPLVLVAPNGMFAVVHAGWRGAVQHIARKSIDMLAKAAGCRAEGINAYIGPHIGVECFEVGADVAKLFEREFGRDVVAQDRFVSLSTAVLVDLQRAGASAGRVVDAQLCTKCNAQSYFSYRASNGACGRNSAVAVRIIDKEQGSM